MEKKTYKNQLIKITLFIQIIISIILFSIPALEISSTPSFFIYSKEKALILLLHFLIIVFQVFIIRRFYNKNSDIQKKINSINSSSSLFIISLVAFSLISSLIWIQSFQKHLTYWGILEKLLPIIFTILSFIISYLIISASIKNDYSQKKYSLSKIEFLKIIITATFSLALFLLFSNSSGSYISYIIQFISFLCLSFFTSIIFYLFDNHHPHTSRKLLLSFVFILILSVFLARNEDSFINWNKYINYLHLKPALYLLFSSGVGVFSINLFLVFRIPTKNTINYKKLYSLIKFLIPTLLVFITFMILIKFYGFIRIPDQFNWRGPANPIFIFQIFIAISLLSFYLYGQSICRNNKNFIQFKSLVLPIAIIIISIISWQWKFQTEMRHHFIIKPSLPNFEYYPGSDSQRLDMSGQLLRYGIPIRGNKPFANYLFFLYHLILGQDYTKIYYIQYILLLLVPLGVYSIGSQLKMPQAGFLASIFVIYQEKNAILLSNEISNITSQLMMSEIPTLIFIIWSTYFFIQFLKKEKTQAIILSGLLITFAIFSRPNAIFVFLIQIIILLFFKSKLFPNINIKNYKIVSFFSSVLIPFMIWNYIDFLIQGRSVLLDKFKNVLLRTINISQTPHHLTAMSISVKSQHLATISDQIQIILNHFLNNVFGIFAFLPTNLTINFPYSINSISFNFWDTQSPWNGSITLIQGILLIINLLLISIGIWKLWQKNKFIAFIPLLIQISYLGSLAFARTSGGRYLEPISWITLIYYSTGIWSVLVFILKNYTNIPIHKLEIKNSRILSLRMNKKINFSIILVLIILFASMILTPFFIPKVNAQQSQESIQKMENIYEASNKNSLLLQNFSNEYQNFEIFETVAFYPVIDNNILTAKIIKNNFYSRMFFPIQQDQTVTLPHDTKMLIAGYIKVNQYPIFVTLAYAYQDESGDWLLFEADQNNLIDLTNQVNWILY